MDRGDNGRVFGDMVGASIGIFTLLGKGWGAVVGKVGHVAVA